MSLAHTRTNLSVVWLSTLQTSQKLTKRRVFFHRLRQIVRCAVQEARSVRHKQDVHRHVVRTAATIRVDRTNFQLNDSIKRIWLGRLYRNGVNIRQHHRSPPMQPSVVVIKVELIRR